MRAFYRPPAFPAGAQTFLKKSFLADLKVDPKYALKSGIPLFFEPFFESFTHC